MTKKVLGQLKPAGLTLSGLYTVPSAKETVISSILCANQSATTTDKVRISISVAGAADDVKQYIVFDASVSANNVIEVTCGITLQATDVVRVRSLNGDVSFNAFGDEGAVT